MTQTIFDEEKIEPGQDGGDQDDWTEFKFDIKLDPEKMVGQRVRYNFWHAVSDVGGAHDGLCIIAKVLVGPFVANLFQYDLVKNS